MTFTALIVDDESLARDELRYLLEQTGQVRGVAEAASGPEALRAVAGHPPDAVFLDVQMPEMGGFEVARRLVAGGDGPLLVFSTAYDEYALQAFEVHARDYLLKPFDPARVAHAVAHLESLLEHRSREQSLERLDMFLARVTGARAMQRLPLERNGRILLVCPDEVLYLSSGETGTVVRTTVDEFRTSLSLQELEDRLRPEPFIRVHRQYIVNLERVAEFIAWPGGTASLVLNDRTRTQVPVARTQVRRVKERLCIAP